MGRESIRDDMAEISDIRGAYLWVAMVTGEAQCNSSSCAQVCVRLLVVSKASSHLKGTTSGHQLISRLGMGND
jgi:hypothetical protein